MKNVSGHEHPIISIHFWSLYFFHFSDFKKKIGYAFWFISVINAIIIANKDE